MYGEKLGIDALEDNPLVSGRRKGGAGQYRYEVDMVLSEDKTEGRLLHVDRMENLSKKCVKVDRYDIERERQCGTGGV